MASSTGIQAKAKPPRHDAAGSSTDTAAPSSGQQNQQHFMSEIVKGMQLRDMSSVATTLSNAVAARVSLPETFLATVKQWMDSRSQTAMASMQMSNLRQSPVGTPGMGSHAATPTARPPMQQLSNASFQELEKRLEDAIIRKDTQAMQAILQQAGQVAGMRMPGMGSMMAGAYMGGMVSIPSMGSMTPSPAMSVGAMTPQMARQYMTSGAMTPPMPGYGPPPGMAGFAYGGITPQMAANRMQGMPGQYPQQGQQRPPQASGTASAGSMTPAASQGEMQPAVLPIADSQASQKVRSPSHSPTFVPTESPGDEEDGAEPPANKQESASRKRQRSSASLLLKTLTEPKQSKVEERAKHSDEVAKMELKAVKVEVEPKGQVDTVKSKVQPDLEFTKRSEPEETASPMPDDMGSRALDFYPPPAATAAREPPSQPTIEQIADFLRTQPKDTAKFRDICKNFRPPALKEFVRKQVEGSNAMFSVIVDRVTLKDPRRKEALNLLVKEIVRRDFLKKQIRPEEVAEHLTAASRYALQATPEDVAKLLIEVAKNTLRRIGPVLPSKYPANMPLVLACMIDRIVLIERSMGAAPRFEHILGPLIHKLIFHRWVLGVTPGSIFLANMLIAWDRMGYFQARHLELPRKSCGLLVMFAKRDGIPDKPHKDEGTGWYSLVQRERYVKGGEAILPLKLLQHIQDLETPTWGDEEQPTATATAPTVELPTAPTAPTVSLPSGADKDGTSVHDKDSPSKRKSPTGGVHDKDSPSKRKSPTGGDETPAKRPRTEAATEAAPETATAIEAVTAAPVS